MKKIITMTLVLCLGFLTCGQQQAHPQGTIVVAIVGLHSNDGDIAITLFHSDDGFPDNPKKALKRQLCRIVDHSCSTKFSGIEFGEYAVSTIHDENGNGQFDTGMFGIPKEGYGASNDAKGFMGPPKFKDAKFTLHSDSLHIKITMNYP